MSVTQQVDDWPGWPDPPVPAPDCSDCGRLYGQWMRAAADRNGARVSDARVLLRRHLGAEHGGQAADADAS